MTLLCKNFKLLKFCYNKTMSRVQKSKNNRSNSDYSKMPWVTAKIFH